MLNVLKNKHMDRSSTSVMNKSHNYLLDIFKLVVNWYTSFYNGYVYKIKHT